LRELETNVPGFGGKFEITSEVSPQNRDSGRLGNLSGRNFKSKAKAGKGSPIGKLMKRVTVMKGVTENIGRKSSVNKQMQTPGAMNKNVSIAR